MQAASIRVREGPADELAVIALRAQASTNASGTAIALSEGNEAEMICRARAGSSAPEVGTALRVDGSFTGLCVQSGKELRCDDAENDTRVDKEAIRALGIRSMVAIPIKVEGRVVGVLAAFALTANAFATAHVVVLKTMAGKVAAYLERKQRDEADTPDPLPAPPVKAATITAAASPAPLPAVVTKPAEPLPTTRQLPVIPKVEPVRTTPLAGETDPAPLTKRPPPLSKEKDTNSRDEQKKSETHFRRPAFGTLDAAAAPESKPRFNVLSVLNVLIMGAAAAAVIAVVLAISIKIRRPAAAPQPVPVVEPFAAPAPDSANAQPPAKNSPAAPPAKHDVGQPVREEEQPEREVTVALSPAPSRISGARDTSASTSDAPAISLGGMPASGALSNLAGPVSQPPRPRLLRQSEFEQVRVIKKVPPIYPLIARQRGLTSSVVVQGMIDKNGRISQLQLISGSPLFRDAAFEAVKQWVL